MANYRLEVKTISRNAGPASNRKGHSIARRINYISGERIRDSYDGQTYYNRRQDVLHCEIFLPDNVPADFHDLQGLCNRIDAAEKRYDARTGREFIGSLPNELPLPDLIQIVREFIHNNFVSRGLCAIAAIHEGRNCDDPTRNNPHVHILVSTRTADANGFSAKKYREHDKHAYIEEWREQWAFVQNQAYARRGRPERVSHESLEVQGINREPIPHLHIVDYQRELRGERTCAGDHKREIEKRNQARTHERQQALERRCSRELERDR